MLKFALLGEKLGHSYSPIIHNEIFKDLGINATYEKLECSIDELKDIINSLKDGKYNGFNVTIPYKKEVMKYLDEIDDRAKAIGAVNTIAYKDGKIIGYNTDYYGFYNSLDYFNINVLNKKCFILGTGGASLALYKALIDKGADTKFVSRNKKDINVVSYDDLKELNHIDLIVNATPIGMYPNIDASPLDEKIIKKCDYVMDIIFNPNQTKLLKHANSNMNGLFMLVGQAVKAEEIWNDKKYNNDILDLLKRVELCINNK